MLSPETTLDELAWVERLVREAGKLVAEYYATGTTVSYKGIDDPVTAADHAANDHLMAGLAAAFPGDGLLSEESADNPARLQRRRVWIVDPLDGTKEFIGRIGEFSIMVGLAIDGQPALGVVYQPVTDVLYRGIPGKLAEVVRRRPGASTCRLDRRRAGSHAPRRQPLPPRSTGSCCLPAAGYHPGSAQRQRWPEGRTAGNGPV